MTPDPLNLVLAQLGGSASRRQLLTVTSRRGLARAVEEGTVERLARGRYAVPGLARDRAAAESLGGVLSLRSAALQHGWEVRTPGPRPSVTVPRGRKVTPERRRGVDVSWRTLRPEDVVDGWVTTPLRTVVDCARMLPVEEALAVADSALRHRDVTSDQLARSVPQLPSLHRRRAELVLTQASHHAENPFESSLRATALSVPGTRFVPQHPIRVDGQLAFHPDVAEPDLKIALEAESFEFHGRRWQLSRDCRRYNQFVVRGWVVLRFAWEDVMFGVEWVRACVESVVALCRSGTRVPEGRPLLADPWSAHGDSWA